MHVVKPDWNNFKGNDILKDDQMDEIFSFAINSSIFIVQGVSVPVLEEEPVGTMVCTITIHFLEGMGFYCIIGV